MFNYPKEKENMSVKYIFEDDGRGVVISADGAVQGSEMLSVMSEIFANEEDIRKYQYGIVDYSQIDTLDISHNQIFALAEIHITASKVNPNIVVGFAITKSLIYGLVRIWMVYANMTGWKVNIKKDIRSIRQWIEENLPAS